MTTIHQLDTVGGWLAFAAWTLVVLGISKALFRSFPAEEFLAWWMSRMSRAAAAIHRMRWELQHNVVWSPDVAQGDPMAAQVALTPDERETRKHALDRLRAGTTPHRAVLYLLACVACQSFWMALGVLAIVNGTFDLPSAFAYSTAAWLVVGRGTSRAPVQAPKGCTGIGCGGHAAP